MSKTKKNRGGRPESLDPFKRQKIIALVANGSSRRVAASVVGCSHSTITRTALRDPQFAADLAAAEHAVEIESLHRIRKAADEARYWRAAAWLAERKNPRDFAARGPTVMDDQQIAQAFLTILDPWIEKLPDRALDRLFRHLDEMLDLFHERPRALRLLKEAADSPKEPPTRHTPSTDSSSAPEPEEDEEPLDDGGSPQPLPPSDFPIGRHAASIPPQ